MAVTPKLEIKQSQSLLMTPQLRQAINLLQMNNIELASLIENELASNPLLISEAESLNDFSPDGQSSKEQSIDDYDAPSPQSEEETFSPDIDYTAAFDDDFGSDREGYNSAAGDYNWQDYALTKTQNRDPDGNFDFFEQKLSDKKSVYQLISEQISLKFTQPEEKLIAFRLAESLDESGYFRGNISDIARQLHISEPRVANVLKTLKSFEPSGLFAENLAECIALQLADDNRLSPLMQQLLTRLDLIAEHRHKELCRLLNISEEQLTAMLAQIRSVNPKPAAGFETGFTSYIIPDVFVRRTKPHFYTVELNNLSLPRVLIDHRYYAEINRLAPQDKATRKFLKNNLGSANFLIRALHQRAQTILRVSEEIVKMQYDFFEKGIDGLRPMTLKDIAAAAEIHESTVSRVTTRKYMQTPRGLFELKYFFSQAAGTYTGNEETSTTAIKHKIKQLITEEAPQNILSDDKLVELLAREGIKIARRTVAKYREAMNLPTSAERKRQKRLKK